MLKPTRTARTRFMMDREKQFLADVARLRAAELALEAARAHLRDAHADGGDTSGDDLARALAEYDREVERWAALLAGGQ